jgi:hypothetical protein
MGRHLCHVSSTPEAEGLVRSLHHVVSKPWFHRRLVTLQDLRADGCIEALPREPYAVRMSSSQPPSEYRRSNSGAGGA